MTLVLKRYAAVVKIVIKALSNPIIGIIKKIKLYNNDGLLLETLYPKHLDSVTIELSHKLMKSQWLTASAFCTNGALCHTSPLYFIVDGKSTYDAVKGPAIIQKLLEILETAKKTEYQKLVIDQGMIERINKPQNYYRNLK